MMLVLCSSVLLALGAGFVASYPTGAPVESCKLLTANHSDHLPQASAAPYQVLVAATSASRTFTVTIEGKRAETFKGFLIQGRDARRNIVGQFESQAGVSQTLACKSSKDSATHVSSVDKDQVVLRWKVPSSFKGTVIFRAAIVKTYETYWDKIVSEPFTIA